jgi:hypothetical protein
MTAEPCSPVIESPAASDTVDGFFLDENTSGSLGCKSLRRTNPEGADFTGS